MSILDLIINSTGFAYQKKASTYGGEYKGPCPFCSDCGTDRFSIHPTQDHYVCRHCKKAGDTIQFYREYHNMAYHDACEAAGHIPNFSKTPLIDKIAKTENWNPRENTVPNKAWQQKGEAVAFTAFKFLMSAAGKPYREYLHSRGLSINTIKKARLGFIDTAISFDPSVWGLSSKDKIWIPRGIIIPYFHPENGLLRLRIRQDNPTTDSRYILVSGSSTEYFSFPAEQDQATQVIYITEGELDGWLCWQEFGDSSLVIAIGNSSTRPDKNIHKNLVAASTILLGLDNDPAGQNESSWWKRQYKNTQICTMTKGKDPGEAFEQGVDLKQWFAGQMETRGLLLDTAKEKSKPQTQPVPQKETQKELPKTVPGTKTIPLPRPRVKQNRVCLHGQFCSFLRESFCIIEKQPISNINTCPIGKWWLYKEKKNSPISQIILGPGVKKL